MTRHRQHAMHRRTVIKPASCCMHAESAGGIYGVAPQTCISAVLSMARLDVTPNGQLIGS
jgi:hypothetical protein